MHFQASFPDRSNSDLHLGQTIFCEMLFIGSPSFLFEIQVTFVMYLSIDLSQLGFAAEQIEHVQPGKVIASVEPRVDLFQ